VQVSSPSTSTPDQNIVYYTSVEVEPNVFEWIAEPFPLNAFDDPTKDYF